VKRVANLFDVAQLLGGAERSALGPAPRADIAVTAAHPLEGRGASAAWRGGAGPDRNDRMNIVT
jgi:hypothetical protein